MKRKKINKKGDGIMKMIKNRIEKKKKNKTKNKTKNKIKNKTRIRTENKTGIKTMKIEKKILPIILNNIQQNIYIE